MKVRKPYNRRWEFILPLSNEAVYASIKNEVCGRPPLMFSALLAVLIWLTSRTEGTPPVWLLWITGGVLTLELWLLLRRQRTISQISRALAENNVTYLVGLLSRRPTSPSRLPILALEALARSSEPEAKSFLRKFCAEETGTRRLSGGIGCVIGCDYHEPADGPEVRIKLFPGSYGHLPPYDVEPGLEDGRSSLPIHELAERVLLNLRMSE